MQIGVLLWLGSFGHHSRWAHSAPLQARRRSSLTQLERLNHHGRMDIISVHFENGDVNMERFAPAPAKQLAPESPRLFELQPAAPKFVARGEEAVVVSSILFQRNFNQVRSPARHPRLSSPPRHPRDSSHVADYRRSPLWLHPVRLGRRGCCGRRRAALALARFQAARAWERRYVLNSCRFSQPIDRSCLKRGACGRH